jgi:hypothetical protein
MSEYSYSFTQLCIAVGLAIIFGTLVSPAIRGVAQYVREQWYERQFFAERKSRQERKEDEDVTRILGAFRDEFYDVRSRVRTFMDSTRPRDPNTLFGSEDPNPYFARHRAIVEAPALPHRVPGIRLAIEAPEALEVFPSLHDMRELDRV